MVRRSRRECAGIACQFRLSQRFRCAPRGSEPLPNIALGPPASAPEPAAGSARPAASGVHRHRRRDGIAGTGKPHGKPSILDSRCATARRRRPAQHDAPRHARPHALSHAPRTASGIAAGRPARAWGGQSPVAVHQGLAPELSRRASPAVGIAGDAPALHAARRCNHGSGRRTSAQCGPFADDADAH